jgi:hypothetical protein
MNSPFPFGVYEFGDDYGIIRKSNASFPYPRILPTDTLEFQFDSGFLGGNQTGLNPARIRQHVVVWTAETRKSFFRI